MSGKKRNPFDDGFDRDAAWRYQRLRPAYPTEVTETIASFLPNGARIADLGAGTGQLSLPLLQAGFQVVAVEPSKGMRDVLSGAPWAEHPDLRVLAASAEETGLLDNSAEALTWADSFHWLDKERATLEAQRILKPGGIAFLVANQLNVSKPWVHRLSRIMRSGDVLREVPGDLLGPFFSLSSKHAWSWEHQLAVEDLLELAKTRSSYLRSSPEVARRMQNNLRWYLIDHLGFRPGEQVLLPYRTLLWAFRKPLE